MCQDNELELEFLAAIVHGALGFGHAVGLMYNWHRRNRIDALIHAAFLVYDAGACLKHIRRT